MSEVPRGSNGRFVRLLCTDHNCGGTLVPDRDAWWRCDGLTHEEADGPLYACGRVHHPIYSDLSQQARHD